MEVHHGLAKVSLDHYEHVLVGQHERELVVALGVASRQVPFLLHQEERIRDLFVSFRRVFDEAALLSVGSPIKGVLRPESVAGVAKRAFPLCMQVCGLLLVGT